MAVVLSLGRRPIPRPVRQFDDRPAPVWSRRAAWLGIWPVGLAGAAAVVFGLYLWWDLLPYLNWGRRDLAVVIATLLSGGGAALAGPVVLVAGRKRAGRWLVPALTCAAGGAVVLGWPALGWIAELWRSLQPSAGGPSDTLVAATAAGLALWLAAGWCAIWLALGRRRFASIAAAPEPPRRPHRPRLHSPAVWALFASLVAIAVSVSALAAGWTPTPRPGPLDATLGGRTGHAWLRALQNPWTRDDAVARLVRAGPPAVPVFEALARAEERPGAQRRETVARWLQRLSPRAPRRRARFLSRLPGFSRADFSLDSCDCWRATARDGIRALVRRHGCDPRLAMALLGDPDLADDDLLRDLVPYWPSFTAERGGHDLLLAARPRRVASLLAQLADARPAAHKAVYQAFERALSEGRTEVRRSVVKHLGGFGARGRELLRKQLGDEEWVVREVLEAYCRAPGLGAADEAALRALFSDPQPAIRTNARMAVLVHRLNDRGLRAWFRIAAAMGSGPRRASPSGALRAAGPAARPLLPDFVAARRTSGAWDPLDTAFVCAGIGGPAAAGVLVDLAEAGRYSIGGFLLPQLLRTDPDAARTAAKRLAESDEPTLAVHGLHVLAVLGELDGGGMRRLAGWLGHADEDVRARSVAALAAVGPAAGAHLPAIRALAADASAEVRLRALVAVAQVSGETGQAIGEIRYRLRSARTRQELWISGFAAALLGSAAKELLPDLRRAIRHSGGLSGGLLRDCARSIEQGRSGNDLLDAALVLS